jgi:hypothetical protein
MTLPELVAGGALPALGPHWMDARYLLDTYGTAFFWISLAMVFVECELILPILNSALHSRWRC